MTKRINKITLFLSALAIVLIVLLMLRFKGLTLFKNASASELSTEDAITELQEYIDSLDGFTDSQREALSLFINDYFDKNNVTTEEDLSVIYKIIDDKYSSNLDGLKSIREELEMKLNAASSSDNMRFEEINNLIKQLDKLIADANSTAEYNKQSLKQSLDNSTTEINNNVNSLSNSMKKSDEELWNEIKELKRRTTSNDKEFVFGYQDGCYGYFIDDDVFKPF